MLALRPLLTVVRAPASVGRRARALKITVASNVPAVFTIAGVRHQVNPKPRTITVGIRPGRSTLRLNYSLSSPGGATRGTYIVSR